MLSTYTPQGKIQVTIMKRTVKQSFKQSITSMEYAKAININIVSIIRNSLEALNDSRDDNYKVVIGIVITKHCLFPNGFCLITMCMNTIKIINNIDNNVKNNDNGNVIIQGDIKSSE